MAQLNKTVTFKNATINTQDWTITEVTKDDTKVYDLKGVLDSWAGVDGITFSLKQVDDLEPMDEDTDNEND